MKGRRRTEDGGRSQGPTVLPGEASPRHERPPSTVLRLPVLAVLFVLAIPAHATITNSAITGRVISANAPTRGVTVTATSTSLLAPRVVTTGARGTYWIGALPPGEYDITFARTGFTTLTRRAVVELARVARVDAVLEASEEEDSVTSTAKTIGVADTTEITTHFSDAMLDRMPTRRDPRSAESIGPAFTGMPYASSVDDAPLARNDLLGEEVIEQVTVIRGGVPADYDDDRGAVLAAITHSGGDGFSLTLRDTISNYAWRAGSLGGEPHGFLHLFESASGGAVVHDRLWFFAAGWSGDAADRILDNVRGYAIKFNAQPAAAHHIVAEVLDGDSDNYLGASLLALRYTATPSERATFEVLLDRSNVDVASARASFRIGEHVLSGGGTATRSTENALTTADRDALYVSDRWSSQRWTVKAGIRHERDDDGSDTLPRIAATFDPRGEGTRAIVATYGEYASFHESPIRIATLGYAAAIGSSGSARIDVVHREQSEQTVNEVQLDARYRLFDRFEAGADYSSIKSVGRDAVDHIAAGWISAQVPIAGHELGATILQRYADVLDAFGGRHYVWPVDLALRYTIPFSRVGLTLATDLTNAFDAGQSFVTDPRAIRVWIRARL